MPMQTTLISKMVATMKAKITASIIKMITTMINNTMIRVPLLLVSMVRLVMLQRANAAVIPKRIQKRSAISP